MASFRSFCLPFIFYSLNMICLAVVSLVFILLGVLWAFWICGLVSVNHCENFSVIISSNIFVPFSLSSSAIRIICILYLLQLFHSSCIFCPTLFSHFLFKVEKFLLIYFKHHLFFAQLCPFYYWVHRMYFSFLL